MAKDKDILPLLRKLNDAYPGLKAERGMIQAYVENLRDMPTWLLKKAIKKQIETSQWFPKVAEIRQTAAGLAGTSNFSGLDPNSADPLVRERVKLEADFYHEGRLDPQAWERLVERFEQAGRAHMAEATREKLKGRVDHLVWRLNQAAAELENAFYQVGRLKAEEWEGLGLEFERIGRRDHAYQAREKFGFLLKIQEDGGRGMAHPLKGTEVEAFKLMAKAQALEDDFFREGRLEAEEWEGLAKQFEQLGRPYQAEGVREKLRRLEVVREEWGTGG